MIILGIDSSTTSTGYAIFDTETKKIITYDCITPDKKLNVYDRIIQIERELKDIINKKKVEAIIIEDLAVTRNASSTKALAGLLYHLIVEFTKRELLVVTVRPSEWRKPCNIKGKDRKELKENTQKYVYDKYKLKVNDDEADAVCIALYSLSLDFEVE